jgi:hypothetical protein
MTAAEWTDERYARLTQRSQALHRHKYVLPVAVWIQEQNVSVAKAPEARRGLGGRGDSNRMLEALVHLSAIGALRELPHPGRPNPRLFEKVESPYWAFAEEFAESDVT